MLRYTDRLTVPAGRLVIGFNATARVHVASAAVAIDDVVLLEGSCDIQGSKQSVRQCAVTGGNSQLAAQLVDSCCCFLL